LPRSIAFAAALLATFAGAATSAEEPRSSADAADGCRDPAIAATLERADANVRLDLVEREGGVTLQAVNLRPAPSELVVSPRDDEAAATRTIVLPPLATVTAMELEDIDKEAARERLGADWQFRSYMGVSGEIAPDDDHLYRLPFRERKTYRLAQGFNGRQSHRSDQSRHALDFQLEVGDAVHAARGGTVVRAVDWFCRAGGRELLSQVNMIVILHDDGTMAHYVHLAHKGVLVGEGERVERGQHIAYTGMTGFTGGPHLHFVVRRERDLSIPIAFEGYADRDLSQRGKFRVP